MRVLPRPRVKDTRAEVIKQASGTTYVHPAALFALTEAELALHAETPREYSWERGHSDEDDQDEVGAAAGETEGEASASTDDDAPCRASILTTSPTTAKTPTKTRISKTTSRMHEVPA